MTMSLQADRHQVLAFRLASHNLALRLPPGSFLAAAAACGIQNSPPGSALLSLGARIQDLTPPEADRALEIDKTLLQVRSIRGVPYIFPTRDLRVFTAGLLPEGEESIRHFILGSGPALDKVGLSASELVERTAAALTDVLDGRVLTFRRLSSEITEQLSGQLSAKQLASWESPSWYAPGQSLGEALVHFALYPVALMGLYCYAPRQGNEASFVRIDQWLGGRGTDYEPSDPRAELARRFLRCFGPTTADHFGEWAGISPAAADRAWKMIEPRLVPVDFAGRRAWLHENDLASFESPPMPRGVRLLPPHDPYLGLRDRETVLPARAAHRLVWRRVGNPGVVLFEGEVLGTWRPQKRGRRLTVTVEPFTALPDQTREEIRLEAGLMGSLRGCTATETIFTD